MAEAATQNASHNDAQGAAGDKDPIVEQIATEVLNLHLPKGAKVPEEVLERVKKLNPHECELMLRHLPKEEEFKEIREYCETHAKTQSEPAKMNAGKKAIPPKEKDKVRGKPVTGNYAHDQTGHGNNLKTSTRTGKPAAHTNRKTEAKNNRKQTGKISQSVTSGKAEVEKHIGDWHGAGSYSWGSATWEVHGPGVGAEAKGDAGFAISPTSKGLHIKGATPGIEGKGSAGASATALTVKATLDIKPLPFTIGNEKLLLSTGGEFEGFIGGKVDGVVGLEVTAEGKEIGSKVEAGVGAFAGAKAGVTAHADVEWVKPSTKTLVSAAAKNSSDIIKKILPTWAPVGLAAKDMTMLVEKVLPLILGEDGQQLIGGASATAGVSYGVGAEAKGSASITGDVIQVRGKFGVTAGLGGEVGGEAKLSTTQLGRLAVALMIDGGEGALQGAIKGAPTAEAYLVKQRGLVLKELASWRTTLAKEAHTLKEWLGSYLH